MLLVFSISSIVKVQNTFYSFGLQICTMFFFLLMQFFRLPLVDRLTSIPLMAAGILFITNVPFSLDKLNLYLLLRKRIDILNFTFYFNNMCMSLFAVIDFDNTDIAWRKYDASEGNT